MNKEFMELMLRAPAAPKAFKPIMPTPEPEYTESEKKAHEHGVPTFRLIQWQNEVEMQTLLQWPSYYARKCLEAAGAEIESKAAHPQENQGHIIREFDTSNGNVSRNLDVGESFRMVDRAGRTLVFTVTGKDPDSGALIAKEDRQ